MKKVLLVLVVIGGGAAALWYYMKNQAAAAAATGGTVSGTASGTATPDQIAAANAALAALPSAAAPTSPSVSVTILPRGATIPTAGTQQYTATVTGGTNGVTWSANAPNGLYTAPSSQTQASTDVVTATSVDDPSKSASTVVSIMSLASSYEGKLINDSPSDPTYLVRNGKRYYMTGDQIDGMYGLASGSNITQYVTRVTTAQLAAIPYVGNATAAIIAGTSSFAPDDLNFAARMQKAKRRWDLADGSCINDLN